MLKPKTPRYADPVENLREPEPAGKLEASALELERTAGEALTCTHVSKKT